MVALRNLMQLKKELGMYLIFGVLTTLISIAGYTVLVKLGWHYLYATSLSWGMAVLFAYITNRRYVFDSQARFLSERLKEMASFFLSRAGTWTMETVGLVLLIEGLAIDSLLSKYIMAGLVVIMNYILSKVFVFKKHTLNENN